MVGTLQPADPQVIGPYRLLGRLGAGGMGRVFLGASAAGRPVAVKVIHAPLAADPEFRARFSVEVAAARKVSGLFTALVVDADVDAPVPWLATSYVAGPSLSQAVRAHGPLSVASVLSLAAGISQAAEAAPLARAGLVVGTPSFMSPEQATGRDVGPLSDVFSLGAVLAYAATGRKPFGGGSAAAVLDRVVCGPAAIQDSPPEVRPLIERCLAKEPGQRPTAAVLLADVTAAQAALEPPPGPASQDADPSPVGEPRPGAARRRPWRPLVTASAVAGLLAASGAAGFGLNAASSPRPGEPARSAPEARMAATPAGLVPTRAAAAPLPRITRTYSYQRGRMVYFVIVFSDPGHSAAGFGFAGANGSDWPRQHYSFSSPSKGIVETNSITYPLDQACGTGYAYMSDIKAWIYDTAGARTKPVVIHLACST